jgi:hypothetical protein
MPSTAIKTLFAKEIENGVDFFAGGRDTFDFNSLTSEEELAIAKAFRKNVNFVKDISANIAAQLLAQENVFIKMGGVAKALFPDDKTVKFPGEPGSIVVDFITPQALMWVKDPDGTTDKTNYGAYSDVAGAATGAHGHMNTWDIDLVAGTPAYLLGGSSGQFYKARATQEKHSMIVLAKDGLLEVGTTPALTHMNVTTEVQTKYSPNAIQPLIDLPMVGGQNIYQYNTPGIITLTHNLGTRMAVMPRETKTSRLQWMGVAFYEYDFMGTMADTWRTP